VFGARLEADEKVVNGIEERHGGGFREGVPVAGFFVGNR
jgi:hypothetical protein